MTYSSNEKKYESTNFVFIYLVGIILTFNKQKTSEIVESIRNFHFDSISLELIEHLIKYLPNDIEIKKFRQLTIDKNDLSSTDRLMYEIIQLPFYIERLNTIKYQLTFSDNTRLLSEQMEIIDQASKILHQSKEIPKFLEITLSVINHMNSTPTHRLLTLDELSKVTEMKTPKTRIPLTKIISQICQDRHPDVFNLKQNVKLFSSASKIDLNIIKTELDQLKQQSQQIRQWMNNFEENQLLRDKFIVDCEHTLDALIREYQQTIDRFHETVTYLTNQSTTSTNFFSIFFHLISSLQIEK